MRHYTSLELNDDEKMDYPTPIKMLKRPDYPCGLMITLTERECEKLDIDPGDAEVGDKVMFHAVARVKRVSQHQSDDGEECCCVSLQIEDMSFNDEDYDDTDDD